MIHWLARGAIFFIAGMGLILSLHYAERHFKPERQIILLNRTRPDLNYLFVVDRDPHSTFPRETWKEYVDYFHLVTDAMPDNSDAKLMLGYFNWIKGHKKEAGEFFKEAYEMDPQFFFTEYDLGLVLFEQGDYGHSALLFQKAVTTAPQQTLERMAKSTIYKQIFSSAKDNNDIVSGLQMAYRDAYLLLMESTAKQKGPQQENASPQIHAHIL